jgi:hypothetical protein
MLKENPKWNPWLYVGKSNFEEPIAGGKLNALLWRIC